VYGLPAQLKWLKEEVRTFVQPHIFSAVKYLSSGHCLLL